MLHLWYERKLDRELNIKTEGVREWTELENLVIYNRTESTPYQALDQLFKFYELRENSNLLDVGCGTGRVAFYVHNKFGIPVTGIELNDLTYHDLINNLHSYLEAQSRHKSPIRFNQEYAEEYQILPAQNLFYFFNPFSIKVFVQVVRNIEQSLFEHPRAVDLILYYPMPDFQQFMETKTIFDRKGSIHLDMLDDEYEKFIVYSYEF